jgi:hypothetical protein
VRDETAYRKRLEEYATHLILTHAKDVESLSVWEMADDFFKDGERPLNEFTVMHVAGLISRAKISIEFPICCPDCEKEDERETSA